MINGVQVSRTVYVPAYGGNGNSRNVSCSKPSLHSQQIGNSEEHATTTRFHQPIGDPEEHASSVFKYNSDEELATTQLRHRTGNNQVSSSSDEVSRR